MTTDLKTQLRDYFQYVDDTQGTVDLGAARPFDEPVKVGSALGGRTVPGWAYGIAASAAVLLLVGGLLWLTRVDGPSVPADKTPVGSVPPRTVPMTVDLISDSATLVEASFDGAVLDAWMNAVTVGGPGLVAVGSAGSERAVAWISPDGRAWERITLPLGAAQAMDVIAGGPGLIAVGADPERQTCSGTGAIWTSFDGVDWSLTDTEGAGSLYAVVAGGPGYVAVGCDQETATVWTSSDGTSWSRTPDDAVFRNGVMLDVIDTPTGLVAVGSSIWTSADGIDWTIVVGRSDVIDPSAPEEGVSWITSITSGGPGFVASGLNGALWMSEDGSSWSVHGSTSNLNDNVLDGLRWLANDGSRLVASTGSRWGQLDAVLISSDGLEWTRVTLGLGDAADALDSLGTFNDMVVNGNEVIFVGEKKGGNTPDSGAWVLTESVDLGEEATVSTFTAKDMVGFWEVVGHTWVEYFEDGSYVIGSPVDPEDVGTFRIEGNFLALTSDIDSQCLAGDVGVYSIDQHDDGSFTIDVVEDDCPWRTVSPPFPHRRTDAYYDEDGNLERP